MRISQQSAATFDISNCYRSFQMIDFEDPPVFDNLKAFSYGNVVLNEPTMLRSQSCLNWRHTRFVRH